MGRWSVPSRLESEVVTGKDAYSITGVTDRDRETGLSTLSSRDRELSPSGIGSGSVNCDEETERGVTDGLAYGEEGLARGEAAAPVGAR